jgi:hypothetical protein
VPSGRAKSDGPASLGRRGRAVTIVRKVSTALCVVCAAVVRIIVVKMVAGKGSCSARLTRSYRLAPIAGGAGLWIILEHAAPGLADTVARSRATGAGACPYAPNACAFRASLVSHKCDASL